VTHQPHSASLVPVEEYLKTQGRFRHLFEPQRDEETLQRTQGRVDDYWHGVAA